jgi:hypothetical protein
MKLNAYRLYDEYAEIDGRRTLVLYITGGINSLPYRKSSDMEGREELPPPAPTTSAAEHHNHRC